MPETAKRPAHTAKARAAEMLPAPSQRRPSVKTMTAPAARRRVRQSQRLKVTRSSRPDRDTSPPRGGAPIGGSQHRLCHGEWRALPGPRRRGASKRCHSRRGAVARVIRVCYGACREHRQEARPAAPRRQKPGGGRRATRPPARRARRAAAGNWRVVNHDTARLLAERGALLVHSAPSVGVRDWSDLRIAVDAGFWLAQARPGDVLEIVTDDQAFDAVGDVATSLGVGFRRLSFRALAGAGVELPPEEARAREPHGRRRRRGGRRGRREGAAPAPARPIAPAANGGEPAGEAHTAPHDELLAVARELLAGAPERTVSIDALSYALKARGFRRTPGSPRLITRLRRIKELEVSRTGAVRLVEPGPAA